MISKKILTSKQEIKDYIGASSDQLFKKYIRAGMPARFEDNRWAAHADNIEEWFRKYTRVSMRKSMEAFQDTKPDRKGENDGIHQIHIQH